MTDIKDLILVYLEDQPAFFARIEDIVPDRKPGWMRMKFLLLQVPVSVGEWILLPEYIQGAAFTMGGKKVRIEKVDFPQETTASPRPPASEGKVVSLQDRKKKSKK
jgi:hypothetical protein